MKVLFVTTEVRPFSKTGGLADVSLELPRALKKAGIDVRIITPEYSDIPYVFRSSMIPLSTFGVTVGWRNQYCGLKYMLYDDLPVYFIDNEYYFKRPGCYGFYDDGERFAYFCRAVMESVVHMDDFYPDVIHCNDWQTGIIPLYLRDVYYQRPEFKRAASIFTIHNLKYQGVFAPSVLEDLLGLNYGYYNDEKLKFRDGVSFMKAGIVFADKVVTVSETYAREITTPYYGEGLDGLLNAKAFKLSGITNGIDYTHNNPENDRNIKLNYDVATRERKKDNKLALQKELGLPQNADVPVIAMVTRLVKEKGIDLVTCVMEDILKNDLQFVMLGTGDRDYMDFFEYYASAYPGKIAAVTRFDGALASRIYAGADIFLMPSMFEPCGLSQIIAMRYGTVPVVRETGGLKDTVKPYNQYTGHGNGFSFANFNAHEMLGALRYALEKYKDHEIWDNIVLEAMNTRIDWETQSKKYIDLYNEIAI
jgi:starch synthase